MARSLASTIQAANAALLVDGTHRGDFAGFPATGKRVVWRDTITSRFRDGRFAEDWVVTGLAERLLRTAGR